MWLCTCLWWLKITGEISTYKQIYMKLDGMTFFLISLMVQIFVTEAVIPEYLPVNEAVERNDAIENYFALGFSASEIIGFLLNVHGINLSLRQLKRILKSRGCRRRG